MATMLLWHGADPYTLDLYGRSALDWASMHPATLVMFLRHCNEVKPLNPGNGGPDCKGLSQASLVGFSRAKRVMNYVTSTSQAKLSFC
ncbi:hypothetical protein BDW66DRAFT_142957 [Aspergillus desertorum]